MELEAGRFSDDMMGDDRDGLRGLEWSGRELGRYKDCLLVESRLRASFDPTLDDGCLVASCRGERNKEGEKFGS